MKKFFLLAIVVLSVSTSCSKQYLCTCTVTGTVTVEQYELYNTKKKATKNCEALSDSSKECNLEAY